MDKSKITNLQELVFESAQCYGDAVYVKEKKGKEVVEKTFNQFYTDCRKLGSFVVEKLEGRHGHIAVIGLTSYEYLVTHLGTVSSGNVIIPLDAQLTPDDLCDHLIRSDAEIFFFDKRYMPLIEKVKSECPKIHTYITLQETDGLNVPQILNDFEPLEWKPIDPKSCAAILYTSGTTGKSKGVMLSHANFIDNAMCQDNESDSSCSLLTVLPIHHVYCFTCDILLSLRYGVTVCVNDSILHIAQNLKFFQPTDILLVPMIAETIYKKIKAAAAATPEIPMAMIAKAVFGGRLRGIFSGGAYLNPELAKNYADIGIHIAQGYGMTECSPRISTGTHEDELSESVGKIVNGCEVKIVDGEIWAKSPSVMMGYYKNPEATAETLTEDGWLKTGDLGYADDQNRLYITGRKKNLIILSNGENVSPEEIENKFAGIDFISEILVYAEDGTICAEIFPSEEYFAQNAEENVQDLFRKTVDEINKGLSSAKNIRKLRVRDVEFDKTTSKKVKRDQAIKGELCK